MAANQRPWYQRLLGGGAAANLGAINAGPPPPAAAPRPGVPNDQLKIARTGGRQTFPSSTTILGSLSYLPRRQSISSLETIDLTRFTPEQIIDLLADASPEVSMALWNNLRLANSGWSVSVKDQSDQDDPAALEEIWDVLRRINARSGGIDAMLDTLHLCGYLHGAMCVEAPPLASLSDIEDIYIVTPWTIRFRWVNLGSQEQPIFVLAMQQWTSSAHTPIWLNPVQTFYVPLDAYPDDPYGRPPAHAGIGAVLFWLDVLRDLRRALHMNAWGRLDIEVVEETIRNQAPPEVQEDENLLRQFIDDTLAAIQKNYASMEPDDSLIHLDSVKVGHVDAAGHVFDTATFMKSIESLIIRGLKQLPTLMGGATSRGAGTLGTLEYQISASGIQALQRMSGAIMARSLELALRLRGRQNTVTWDWNSVRTTERLKDAQAEALEIQNATRKYQMGWISHDDASAEVTGHPPAEPEPLSMQSVLADRPSPPPQETNTEQNPANGIQPDQTQPTVAESTGEGGDQSGAPKPAPSREVIHAGQGDGAN